MQQLCERAQSWCFYTTLDCTWTAKEPLSKTLLNRKTRNKLISKLAGSSLSPGAAVIKSVLLAAEPCGAMGATGDAAGKTRQLQFEPELTGRVKDYREAWCLTVCLHYGDCPDIGMWAQPPDRRKHSFVNIAVSTLRVLSV